jgi:hypothetical protein
MNTIKEIRRYISQFASCHNIDITNAELSTFMKQVTNQRRPTLSKDTFILICEYINTIDTIAFTTSCKENMEHYADIWCNIQQFEFPQSIINYPKYHITRQNIAVFYWHRESIQILGGTFNWDVLENIENDIKKLSTKLKMMTRQSVGYKHRLYYNTAEIRSLKKERKSLLDEFPDVTMSFMKQYMFMSECDFMGEHYYTIKPDLDMRLYGLDPLHRDDVMKWEHHVNWIMGHYNENRKDYDYDDAEPYDDDKYTYGTTYIANDVYNYRSRKRPYWV